MTNINTNLQTLGDSIPAGVIMPYAGVVLPSGWLFCNGQQFSTTTYANLYAAIGITYGSGTGTFAVPNMISAVPVGKDNMGGTSANRLTDTWADSLGSLGGCACPNTTFPCHIHSFGSWGNTTGTWCFSLASCADHTHSYTWNNDACTGSNNRMSGSGLSQTAGGINSYGCMDGQGVSDFNHSHLLSSLSSPAQGVVSGARIGAGTSADSNITLTVSSLQSTIVLNYIIKY